VILTVTPNPALDLTWRTERLGVGESHRVATGSSRAGGKGLNVARVLHSTGHDVLAVATVGGRSGEELIADLDASGIPHRLLPVGVATRRSIAIVEDPTGEATVLNERGEGLTQDEAQRLLRLARESARDCDAVTVSGSLAPGIEPHDIGALVRDLVGLGIPVIADLSGPALLAAASAGAYAVKPNRQELWATTGLTDPVAGSRVLLDAGAEVVVTSLGSEGMLLVSADDPTRPLRASLPHVLHGNATGAGDAAVAALAIFFAGRDLSVKPSHADLKSVARMAVGWSASAVLMPLAGEVSPERAALATEVVLSSDPEK
jgi:1-phosphofructokinase family hexose kinase